MKKLNVYLRIPQVADCGVGYYRQWLPMEIAKKNGVLDYRCHNFTWGERGDESKDPIKEPSIEDVGKSARWADIVYYSRNDVPQYIAEAGGIRDFHFNNHGVYKPVILDIDDNVQATRPYNPGYRSFHPNSSCNSWNIKSLGVYDAITVSTQNLKDFYSDYTDPEKIYVCPNSLDMKERDKWFKYDFKDSELFKKAEGEIRLGWTGSASHWENLKHIEQPILDILRKYPQVKFYYTGLFGDLFQDQELVSQGRIVSVKWSGLRNWARFNREVNFDIALAPLTDNMFNRAKSNLRVLEYGSARFPVICSPVEPYKCFTKEEVIFATEKDEWFEAIEKLIKKPDLRKKLAQNLYKRVNKDYNINKNYKIWVSALTDIQKKSQKLAKNLIKTSINKE